MVRKGTTDPISEEEPVPATGEAPLEVQILQVQPAFDTEGSNGSPEAPVATPTTAPGGVEPPRRRRRAWWLVLAAVLLAGAGVGAWWLLTQRDSGPLVLTASLEPSSAASAEPASPTPSPTPTPLPQAKITQVVDGQTVVATYSGEAVTIRLISVDAPEVLKTGEIECYAERSRVAADELLAGRQVGLEFGPKKEDDVGQMLAYVWIGDELANLTLVRGGHARAEVRTPNVRHAQLIELAEERASRQKLGLWGACSRL